MVTEQRIREIIKEENIRGLVKEEIKKRYVKVERQPTWQNKVHVVWTYFIMLLIMNILAFFGEIITGIQLMPMMAVMDIVFGIVAFGLAFMELNKLYNKQSRLRD